MKENIQAKDLKRHLARVVLIAPSINPKNGQRHGEEVIFTVRPRWSVSGAYSPALPGGKIEIATGDFDGIVDAQLLVDPHLILTVDQVVQAGLKAAEREVLEELGITLAIGLLQFVDTSSTKAGWISHSYVGKLEEKPTLLVTPDSAGTIWMSVQHILQGRPRLLPGHLGITRRALRSVDIN